jgi:asparagine synthase (glutamine-hydrolysing)
MCGIAGIVYFDKSAHEIVQQIHTATQALAHRGPDDEGYFLFDQENSVHAIGADTPRITNFFNLPHIAELYNTPYKLALGHRRLSIIDLSCKAHQPMSSIDGHFTLVYNGEIYNYIQLREQLMQEGYAFQSASDTEVLLVGWQHWGRDLLQKLDGMWAFAIFNHVTKVITLATDPHGVKPLYYTPLENGFAFASEIKALLNLKPAVMHKQTALDFLFFGKIDHSSTTFFKDIYRLSGGHLIEINLESKSINQIQYYHLSVSDEYRKWSPAEGTQIINDIRELLLKCVAQHLIADVPVATTLSGGIDSAALLGMVNHIYKQNKSAAVPLHVFSITFPGATNDESRFAKEALKGVEAIWHPITPQMEQFEPDLPAFLQSFEEPVPGINAYAHFVLTRHVKEAGLKVVLDGQGADELFGGYQKHFNALLYTLFVQHRWAEFIANFKSAHHSFNRMEWLKLAVKAKLPSALFTLLHPMQRFLTREFYKLIKPESESGYNFHPGLNKTLYLDSHNGILSFLLKAADHTAMHFSVESRVPYADSMSLSHYLHRLPYNFKIQHGVSKYLLREAAKPFLPELIYKRRDKLGFSIPKAQWLMSIKRTALQHLDALPTGFLQKNFILNSYESLAQTPGNDERLWRTISFAFWHKAFIS